MRVDFHCHGKLTKNIPFSKEYTKHMLEEAKLAGLDGICLTEHFNTLEFDKIYNYIKDISDKDKDTYVYEGLRMFIGMEIDISEIAHTLVIGHFDEIMEINYRLENNKDLDKFLSFDDLYDLISSYDLIFGAAHPNRPGTNILKLRDEQIEKFDFFDLNAKDLARDFDKTQEITFGLGYKFRKAVLAGSDTHQALQYGTVWTEFEENINDLSVLRKAMDDRSYRLGYANDLKTKVKSADLVKKNLKEIHRLGGDYVSILVDN